MSANIKSPIRSSLEKCHVGGLIGAKNGSDIKNTPIKLILCTKGFLEVRNSMVKLKIFLIYGQYCHFRTQEMGQIVTISKTSPKGFQVRDLKVRIIGDEIENGSYFRGIFEAR